jgi:hypothetical protein
MGEPTRIIDPDDLRSALNNTGVTIVKNTCVVWHTTEREIALPAAANVPFAGVTQEDIATGYYGTIQQRGKTVIRAHGALATIGIRLEMVAATGRVNTHGGTDTVVGTLLTTAGAQDDLVEVELSGPGGLGPSS